MQVNGHTLPARLVDLVEAGRWERPSDTTHLAKLTGAEQPAEFTFYQFLGMSLETTGAVRLKRTGTSDGYSLTDASEQTAHDPGLLNVDQAVIIAGNRNEEVIALDYRGHPDPPKVICGIWLNSTSPQKWHVIAATFDAFADYLNL